MSSFILQAWFFGISSDFFRFPEEAKRLVRTEKRKTQQRLYFAIHFLPFTIDIPGYSC